MQVKPITTTSPSARSRLDTEHGLDPYYFGYGVKNDTNDHPPEKSEVVRCTNSGCKHNIKHSTIVHMVAQGAPLRCKKCRRGCWKCGSDHRNQRKTDSVPELCRKCQQTELLQIIGAYDDDSGLPDHVLSVATQHFHREEPFSLMAALLRKAPHKHSCVSLSDANGKCGQVTINTLRDLGVKEWVLKSIVDAHRLDRIRREHMGGSFLLF